MISYSEAIALVNLHMPMPCTEQIALDEADGRALALDIVSPTDHPYFDNSSVDGYGIRFSERNMPLQIVGEVKAGSFYAQPLSEKAAIRIFTGAPIPDGVDTVVMQEHVLIDQDQEVIHVQDDGLKPGSGIRRKGGQIGAGDITLKKGRRITPAGIGFLASIGVFEIPVYSRPRVGILVSGNEFVEPGKKPEQGKIYESIGLMLRAALNRLGVQSVFKTVHDNQAQLEEKISSLIQLNDVVLITGGVSVGDYDFTRAALESCDYETIFHRVRQKPGMPLLFARHKDGKIAFGLPGNPRSALMCYYLYVLPLLNGMMGCKSMDLRCTASAPIRKRDDGKTHFIAGRLEGRSFEPLAIQDSHMLLSMTNANGIAIVPADVFEIQVGKEVKVRLIDN